MEFVLRLTEEQHSKLHGHLFPGDGKEAVALIECGRRDGRDRHVLVAKNIHLIPHDACTERTQEGVVWPTRFVDPLLPDALKYGRAIVKIHSHPTGYPRFSESDDRADLSFLGSVHCSLETGQPHGSAVMLPDGRIFARVLLSDNSFRPVELVALVGTDLKFWHVERDYSLPDFVLRHAQAFGSGTVQLLQRLRIAVIGCSGTGSPLISQLVRLGVGFLLLVDPDRTEEKNLNRIYFTTRKDAEGKRFKVNVMAEAIKRIDLGTKVATFTDYLERPEVVRAVAECDLVFGCTDSMSSRDLLNRLATFYSLPYIDLGVQLRAKPHGGVEQIVGAVHYLQPGLSSLYSREVYDYEDVRAELMKRHDPQEYERQLKEKYIKGVQEDRPAVISINTQTASMAINELLARVHCFRYEPNEEYAAQWLALHEGQIFRKSERELPKCSVLQKHVGRGDTALLLDRPELSEGE